MFLPEEIRKIAEHFHVTYEKIEKEINTSHGDDDIRLNYVLDRAYVLKINSQSVMQEERLQEISRLIERYRSIDVYCPRLIRTADGKLSSKLTRNGKDFTCYMEEYARYPVFEEGMDCDRRQVVEHLGMLAAEYTGVDLIDTRSMWSLIDLAPLDVDIDEKQDNTNMLVDALRRSGFEELAGKTDVLNDGMRQRIKEVFDQLPRCVYQGDLNRTNELHDNGRFVGLIDFNLSGTDVNINVFLNETNWFPEEIEFDTMSVEAIVQKMDEEQRRRLNAIFRHYTLNKEEKFAFPYYKRIVDLFQYPNVCEMIKWLKEENRREKCAALIHALTEATF